MKFANELAHEDLIELVAQIQWSFYGRERQTGERTVEFFDADKKFTLDMLDDIATALARRELTPHLGSDAIEWETRMLHYCPACAFEFEDPKRPYFRVADPLDTDAREDALTCPRCGGPCSSQSPE